MKSSLSSSVAGSMNRRKRNAYVALSVVLLFAIVLLTLLPASGKHFLHTRGRFHSAGHVLAFTGLAFAVGRTSRSWAVLFLLLGGLIFFGFCTEFAEHTFFAIGLEWKDIVGDTVGAIFGLSLAVMTQRRRRMRAALRTSENPA